MNSNIQTAFGKWLMNDNSFELYPKGKYTCDAKAKQEYIDALNALLTLQVEGKCCKVEANDPDQPYQVHAIYVKWTPDDYGEVQPETKLLIEGLREMNLLISDDDPLNWQISKVIYHSC